MTNLIRGLIATLLSATLLTACTGGESNVSKGNREGILHYGNGSEPQGLDPQVVTGVPENHIVSSLFEGLTTKNPWNLEPEPGVAMSWDISEDGKVYTFHLNPEAKWSNGEVITASDFVWSWNRALHPKMGNQYSYMLFPVEGAEAYAKRETEDFNDVGVKAIDDHTLEVTLIASTPYFLQLLDHYSTYPVHPETILKHGEMYDRYTKWTRPENMVGNGAFVLDEWLLNRRVSVKKSETYWDRDTVKLNGVIFYPTENIVSEERMFRVDQLHYTQEVPLDKLPVYKAKENSPLRLSPYLGSYFYLFNTEQAPVDDVRVRKALAMSIDRDKLIRTVLHGIYTPSYSITPPGTMGYNPPKLFDYDPEQARQLLAEAGYPNGEGWPGVEVIYNTSENHRKIAVALQQMWKDELNINITISNQEWKVYLDSIDTMNYAIARRGWIGDYVDANNFLDMYLTGGGNNNTGFAEPAYDEMIARLAPRAKTQEERYKIFYEAETMLMEQMPILPIYTYSSKHLLHPSVRDMPANLMDHLNLKYVWLDENWNAANEETK